MLGNSHGDDFDCLHLIILSSLYLSVIACLRVSNYADLNMCLYLYCQMHLTFIKNGL